MDAKLLTTVIADKCFFQLKKLGYKFPMLQIDEMLHLLMDGKLYHTLPLPDFNGKELICFPGALSTLGQAARLLYGRNPTQSPYGKRAMEDEIAATLTIENIDFSRESVRDMLNGIAPRDESEQRIYGMKRGLEFICDPAHDITAKNLGLLYHLMMDNNLSEDDTLLPGALYRHDTVHVMGQKVEHTGLNHKKLPEAMDRLFAFIRQPTDLDDLHKAAIIHFHLAWLHPYFDGNGRMARMLQLWFLFRRGYGMALFVPLSRYVEESRRKYYAAFTQVEENASISGRLDVTPFLLYFQHEVYEKLKLEMPEDGMMDRYRQALDSGGVTEKESLLWGYVLSHYGTSPFSTKMLEKDYHDVAYATVRSFVLKFEKLGLLISQTYGSRVKYSICQNQG